MLRTQLKPVGRGGWLYPNLLDSCGPGSPPPFQVDGNFGATAAITAMLLQSQTGIIQLLPALPKAWPTGSVTGLVAKGAVVVNETWTHGACVRAELFPRLNGQIRLVPPPNQRITRIASESGAIRNFHVGSRGVIIFQALANNRYTVRFSG